MATMVEPHAKIRTFRLSDQEQVLDNILKADMESWAVANRRAYTHLITIALWDVLSCLLVKYEQWEPVPLHGASGYMRPLPAFVLAAIALLVGIHLIHRTQFKRRMLENPDVTDITSHYSRSKWSSFWVLEYNDKVIGFVAIDASRPAGGSDCAQFPGSSSVAILRHFYVTSTYRKGDMQSELLAHALGRVFSAKNRIRYIYARDLPLADHVTRALHQAGFRPKRTVGMKRIGVLRWKMRLCVLSREQWKMAQGFK